MDVHEPLGFQTSDPTGLIGPSSLRMGGEAAKETAIRRHIDPMHATITTTWSPSNRATPSWGPGQDPWGLGYWEVEHPPMDLRQHPNVPVQTIRGLTTGLHNQVNIILPNGSGSWMRDTRTQKGVTKETALMYILFDHGYLKQLNDYRDI